MIGINTSRKKPWRKWSKLKNSATERDPGIMVSEGLSWEVQIDNVLKKANRILDMLKRTFYSRDCVIFMSHL